MKAVWFGRQIVVKTWDHKQNKWLKNIPKLRKTAKVLWYLNDLYIQSVWYAVKEHDSQWGILLSALLKNMKSFTCMLTCETTWTHENCTVSHEKSFITFSDSRTRKNTYGLNSLISRVGKKERNCSLVFFIKTIWTEQRKSGFSKL